MKNVFKPIFIIAIILLNFTACQKTETINPNAFDDELNDGLYDREYVLNKLESPDKKDWKTERELDPLFVYSIGMYTDSTFIVGYKPSSVNGLKEMVDQFTSSPHGWLEEKDEVLKIISTGDSDFVNLTPTSKNGSPFLLIKTSSFDVIKDLIESPLVYSVEPSAELFLISTSKKGYASFLNKFGCRCNAPDEIPATDLLPLTPMSGQPWNYAKNFIHEEAWDISSGDNIGVAVIDSGVSFDQENLDNNGDFMQGLSVNRNEVRDNFLGATLEVAEVELAPGIWVSVLVEEVDLIDVVGPHDRCGHGTRMAGLVAAPRGVDYNVAGIAYNCDLYNYRAVHNPLIITALEKLAVADALWETVLHSNIRIISMSIGQLPYLESSSIEFALMGAVNVDKLIICAAGTFIAGLPVVVFPANSSLTVATTGIQEPIGWNGSPLDNQTQPCDVCHYGPDVDFAVIIQDQDLANLDRTTLAVTCEGDIPDYSSGSSSSTASLSGIAALIWAKDVNQTRNDIIGIMQQSSSNPNGDHALFGWGVINVYDALQ